MKTNQVNNRLQAPNHRHGPTHIKEGGSAMGNNTERLLGCILNENLYDTPLLAYGLGTEMGGVRFARLDNPRTH